MLLERMVAELHLPTEYILKTARSASHHYKSYEIPKKAGGHRTIHHPSRELKGLQRWLLRHVIDGLPVDEHAYAYRTGRTIADNARCHVNSKYLVRMDFADFFPSITAQDIKYCITRNPGYFPGWTSLDVEIFCQLVCRRERLTIGAPTSPSLSNVLCRELDVRLARLADDHDSVYTRYADDLFFSSKGPNVLGDLETLVRTEIESLKCPAALRINAGKTRHFSKRGRRCVTGIVLGSDGKIYVGRRLKRMIRSLVYKIEELNNDRRARLAGYIGYCQAIDPDFVNSLVIKFGREKLGLVRFPSSRLI